MFVVISHVVGMVYVLVMSLNNYLKGLKGCPGQQGKDLTLLNDNLTFCETCLKQSCSKLVELAVV